MSDTDIPPLAPDIKALLDAEQQRPEPDPKVKARIYAGVAATLGLPAGLGPDGQGPTGSDGAAGAADGSTAAPAGTGSAPSAGPAAPLVQASTAATAADPLAAVLKPVTLVAFALGAAVGTGATYTLVTRPAQQVVVQQQPTAPTPPTTPAATPTINRKRVAVAPAPPPLPQAVPATPPKRSPAVLAKRPARTKRASAVNLAAERHLIEQARTALGRSRPADALGALYQHRTRFPRGQLVEEREALLVLALAGSGRVDEARKRAKVFRRRFPSSLLLPAVEAALRAAPKASE